MLQYIYQQLNNMKAVHRLPQDIEQRESVVNRALDVRSSCMIYIARLISHESTILGMTGTIHCLNLRFFIDLCREDNKNYFCRR